MKNIFAALVVSLLLTISFTAQAHDDRKNEFAVWGGFSPDSNTFIKAFGRSPDARFGIVAFRYSRRFNNNDKVNLKYTTDVIPVAFLNFIDPFSFPQARHTAYGFGVTPLGMQVNFRPRKKYQPFVGITGGFMYFDKHVPNNFGTRFHFTADVEGGVEIKVRETRSVILGYKYYHISNGGRGQINPGFDNNLIYLGYRFFSK